MRCKSNFVRKDGARFNCGKCPHCKANLNSQWKLRNIYELESWSCAMWVTLTYNDDWLLSHNVSKEGYYTLKKSDIVNFNKRLRSDIEYHEHGRKIKFYCVGEYSPEKQRPHYHCIYYGLDYFSNHDRQYIIDNWCPRCDEFQFDIRRGKKCAIQPVTPKDIGYTTDYNNKKLFGEYADNEYKNKGREPPFHTLSQGLGLDFALKNSTRLKQNGYTIIGGKKIGLPKYFRDKLGINLDLSDNPLKKQNIYDVNEFLLQQFFKDTKIHFKPTFETIDILMPKYERWYQSYEEKMADVIYSDFLKRQEIYHKERL